MTGATRPVPEPLPPNLDSSGETLEPVQIPETPAVVHEVFNPDNTVGVGCNRDGEVIGLHLTDDARENGDTWLAAEIVRLARLAHLKSRVALRAHMERQGVLPHTIDAFDLPTEATYRAAEHAEFGANH